MEKKCLSTTAREFCFLLEIDLAEYADFVGMTSREYWLTNVESQLGIDRRIQ
jgi:hypothetical protein